MRRNNRKRRDEGTKEGRTNSHRGRQREKQGKKAELKQGRRGDEKSRAEKGNTETNN
jgi:hypothetical protein